MSQQANVQRIASKCKETFLQGKLMKELGLNKATAKSLIEIFLDLFFLWFGPSRSPHQIVRSAVSVCEPPGKPIKYCELVSVYLTVDHPDDGQILLREGSVKARMIKCFRIVWEAYEQGGALSVDDIAVILTIDPSTVKDYIRKLEDRGLFVPTRGRLKDIGRVPSHKQQICTLLAQGYTYTEISSMTNHTERSIERYALSFGKVIYLADQGANFNDIRLITKLGKAELKLLLSLYHRFNDEHHQEHLKRLKKRYELCGNDSHIELPNVTGKKVQKEDRQLQRTLEQGIRQLLQELLDLTPRISLMVTKDILSFFEKAVPSPQRLYPGQTTIMTDARETYHIAGDKHTDRKLIPIVLSVNTADKRKLWHSERPMWEKIAIIAHALGQEAVNQGGILSISQVADLLYYSESAVSHALRQWHKEMLMELPFKGYLEDCGLTLTHKEEIIALEMDGATPAEISHLTNHTPQSRDRYLDMFHRLVAFCRVLKQVPEVQQVRKMLGCRKSVASQYLKILKKHMKTLAASNTAEAKVGQS